MAVITSPDTVCNVTVTVTQDPKGMYIVAISQVTPVGVPLAVEFGGRRVYEGNAAVDSGSG